MTEFYIRKNHENRKFLALAFLSSLEFVRNTEDGYALWNCPDELFDYFKKQFPARLIRNF